MKGCLSHKQSGNSIANVQRKKKRQQVAAALLAVLMTGAFLTGCGQVKESNATGLYMGTVCSARVYSDRGEELLATAKQTIVDLEEKLLSKRIETSELATINRGERTEASEPLEKILATCLQVARDSDGAFDPCLGRLTDLWKLDEVSGEELAQLPEQNELENAKDKSGYNKLQLSDTAVSLADGAWLDLGAVGKGYALDVLYELLEQNKAEGAIISMGGSILTYKGKPDKSAFQIAVANPYSESGEPYGILTLNGTHFISTSGDYERYAIINNMRYHHILDGRTGYPAINGVRSVTVVCDNGLLSDALSTACFVLGKEKGMELADKYHAGVIILMEDETMAISPALEESFTVTR